METNSTVRPLTPEQAQELKRRIANMRAGIPVDDIEAYDSAPYKAIDELTAPEGERISLTPKQANVILKAGRMHFETDKHCYVSLCQIVDAFTVEAKGVK